MSKQDARRRDAIILAIRTELNRQADLPLAAPAACHVYFEDDTGIGVDGIIDLYAIAEAIQKAEDAL